MSDQISEKMARKLTEALAFEQAGKDMIFKAWESAGLIEKSKLDEARERLRRVCLHKKADDPYRKGFEDATKHFEAAITEILEGRECSYTSSL